jgi:hypothetical protein
LDAGCLSASKLVGLRAACLAELRGAFRCRPDRLPARRVLFGAKRQRYGAGLGRLRGFRDLAGRFPYDPIRASLAAVPTHEATTVCTQSAAITASRLNRHPRKETARVYEPQML